MLAFHGHGRAAPCCREMDAIVFAHHDPKEGAEALSYAEMQVSTSWQQFRALLSRNFTMYWRSPEYNFTFCNHNFGRLNLRLPVLAAGR